MPSNRKKGKKKRTKSKTANAKRVKKVPTRHVKRAGRLKRVAKRKQAKKKTSQARVAGNQRTLMGDAQFPESARRRPGSLSGRQSGDLQGLSRSEQADSESVDELVEEGNLFEAGAVAGVEEASNKDEREVHTREVSEDDVPEEYLDEQ